MLNRIDSTRMSAVFKKAMKGKLINDDDSAVIFYDLTGIKERLDEFRKLFPPNTLHAVAVKANPLYRILRFINGTGAGAECATFGELYLARQAGFHSKKIVFDSPAKTIEEMRYALQLGVHINIDSFRELEKLSSLKNKIESGSTFGIRINPQVGTGRIALSSLAGEYSKFGVPLKSGRGKLIDKYLEHDWLRGVHLHVGSQGCDVGLLAKGVGAVLGFALEVNDILEKKGYGRRIDIFDIGGGLPVQYDPDENAPTMMEYSTLLKSQYPELFDGRFKLITEFGRYVHANCGWTASRVEYVKRDNGINTAMIHVGADLFLRECYIPEYWGHEITVLGRDGRVKDTDHENYALAGPLCFAGDMLEKNILLPRIEEGDYIVVHDTGAYTLSMWSRYNSRQVPKVLGYYEQGDHFEVLKERETPEKIIEFWS